MAAMSCCRKVVGANEIRFSGLVGSRLIELRSAAVAAKRRVPVHPPGCFPDLSLCCDRAESRTLALARRFLPAADRPLGSGSLDRLERMWKRDLRMRPASRGEQ